MDSDLHDSTYLRAVNGRRPRIMDDMDKLRKLVNDLRCNLGEQKEEVKQTKADVADLKRQLDKAGVLAKSQTKDPKPSIEASASTALRPTVAALAKATDAGHWVIYHGQCWKRKLGTARKLELVSDLEMATLKSISWKDLRGLTDRELRQRYSIVRGGGQRALGGFDKAELVGSRCMEKATEKFAISLLSKLATAPTILRKDKDASDKTDSDDAEDDKSEEEDTDHSEKSDRDESDEETNGSGSENGSDGEEETKYGSGSEDEGDKSDAEAEDKKPDLRRRQRRSDKNQAPGPVYCDKGHRSRLNTSNGTKDCDDCNQVVPKGKKFWRCSECDWNCCLACLE